MVAPATASACSCIAAHPATKLAQSERALVGVVESRTPIGNGQVSGGWEYVVRVERMLKGVAAERVTLRSGITSCQLRLAVGQRVGLTHVGEDQQIFSCGYVDPDELLAASELPQPTGSARYEAAVEGVRGTDTVQLGADGTIAGYSFPQGKPLAMARCGDGVTRVVRTGEGTVRVHSVEVALRDVSGVACTENGRRGWVVGRDGAQTQLITVFNGAAEVRMRRAADASAIAGSRAYFAHGSLVRIVPLIDGRIRSARVPGGFTSIAGNGDRVAGRLEDGRTAVLNVRTGKLVTGAKGGRLVWLGDDRLLDPERRTVLDTRLRVVRTFSGTRGTFVGTVNGATFFADGRTLYRAARGAKRVVKLGELPGRVTAVVAAPSSRTLKGNWHSCNESANSLLTP